MFNLFILDYFGLFSFGFRLSVHLDLLQNLGIRNCSRTCVDRYSEGQFGHIRYCKIDFRRLYNYFPLLIVNDHFVFNKFC